MPKRTDIKSILIIGAGPIVIGQACEFDYSGTQACKALKAEGYRIVLVNSNPATIMTDPDLADATYIEPITPEMVAKIIARERPDALLPTMGGQTALNTAMALARSGVLRDFRVELIGASETAIAKAEDRQLFRLAMDKIGLESPKSRLISSLDAAVEVRAASAQRTVPLNDLYRLPADTPHMETVLQPGEVIAAITVPPSPAARRSHYLKVRDRASFEFAVVSAAVALEIDGARIRQARVALGGVGTKPWRVARVEAALAGANLDPAALRQAAAAAAHGAQGRGDNDFKIELMQRAIVRAVETAGARA